MFWEPRKSYRRFYMKIEMYSEKHMEHTLQAIVIDVLVMKLYKKIEIKI